MANHAPTAPPDSKQSQPPQPSLIPVKGIQFLPGLNFDVGPGLNHTNAASSQEPSKAAFRRIFFDARAQRFVVMSFAADPDMNRAPAVVKDFPAAICISERAL